MLSVQPQRKPEIQQKLERWRPSKVSIKSLKDRVSKATRKRGQILNEKSSRAATQFNRAKTVSSKTISEMKEKEKCLVESIETKMKHASQRKGDLDARFIEAAKLKNQSKLLKVDTLNSVIKRIEKQAKDALDDKLLSGKERKDLNLAKKIEKVSKSNQLVTERLDEEKRNRAFAEREIHCKHENKLMSASKRKQLYSAGNGGKFNEKMERVQHHKLAQDADQFSIKRALDEKMVSAKRRKEEIVFARVAKASTSNQLVSRRVQNVLMTREDRVREIQCKSEMKSSRKSPGEDLVIRGEKVSIQSDLQNEVAIKLENKLDEALVDNATSIETEPKKEGGTKELFLPLANGESPAKSLWESLQSILFSKMTVLVSLVRGFLRR